jgi:predicted nucleic acid-binding protein
MPRTIIADTSCFIILSKINELSLLKSLYGSVTTTPEIASEFGQPLPDWVIIKPVQDKQKLYLLELQIDKGESSALVLAMEQGECTVVLDDQKARKIAAHLHIPYTGTLGIIVKAKTAGYITSIVPILEKIRETNFRISPMLEKNLLELAGE